MKYSVLVKPECGDKPFKPVIVYTVDGKKRSGAYVPDGGGRFIVNGENVTKKVIYWSAVPTDKRQHGLRANTPNVASSNFE